MDQTRFDTLTRALVGAGSRRALLRTTLSLGLAGLLGRRPADEIEIAWATRRHRHRACTSTDECPSCQTCQIAVGQSKGRCVAATDGAACGGDCGVCDGGHCRPHDADCDPCERCDAHSLTCRPRCASAQSCCNGACCDTGCIIPDGGCCPPDRFCAGHLCCDADETCCGDRCCPAGQTCCRDGCCDQPCGSDGTCSVCPSGQQCGALCCPDGSVCCNGHCEEQSRNPHPCGSTGCCFGTEVCCQGPYNPEPGCVPAGSC